MEDNREIDILRLLEVLLKRWYLIIGAAVLCSVLAFLYTMFLVTPLYRSTVQIYVSNKVDYNTNQEHVAINDIYTSQSLVPIYSTMLGTNMVLEAVASSDDLTKAGIHYSAAQLGSMLSTKQYENTAILRLTVANPNKEYCAIIANAIATTGVTEVSNVNPGSTAYVIDEADVPNAPFYPSKTRNAMLGFVLGFVLVAAILVIRDILDTKVRDEDMLSNIIGAPVLGRISVLNTTSK